MKLSTIDYGGTTTVFPNGTVSRVLDGGPQREIFLIEVVVFLSLLLRNIAIPWIFLGRKFNAGAASYWSKFSLDFVFLVCPGLLAMTIMSSSVFLLIVVLAVCVSTLLVFVVCEYLMSPDRVAWRQIMNKIIDEHYGPTTFVTYFRSAMLIVVSIAILAVDFSIFPKRFAKTEHYGHSVMDIGVASFVVAAALGSRLKTSSMREGKEITKSRSWWWLCSSYLILPCIGLSRTIVLSLLDYYQPVTEYGVHWNFFYTFAIIRIVSKVVPSRFPILTTVVFGVAQQLLLMNGLEDWILYGDNPRDTLLTANIEGVASLMGYITLHYASIAIGDWVAHTGIRVKSWLECCLRLFVLSAVFFLLQMVCEWILGPPSRRVANITYVMSQLCFLIFCLALFLAVQMFNMVAWAANAPHFSSDENPFFGVQPCLLESINKNGLSFFLISNLFTGMVNLSLDTKSADDATAFSILVGYMILVCSVVHYRGYMRLKDKKK